MPDTAAMSQKLVSLLLSKEKMSVKVVALILVVIAIAFGAKYDDFLPGDQPAQPETLPGDRPAQPAQPRTTAAKPAKSVGGYEQLPDARMVGHRNNDGDSFVVSAGGREFELRLYFADAAEKYYSDRYEDQRERVQEQAEDFGGLSIDETTKLGEAAKKYVASLIEDQPFTIFTKWERVYGGERFHGFVEIDDPDHRGQSVYLCELLVRKGLARIHTGGSATPDGRSFNAYRDHLRKVEADAKRDRVGAWGL